MQVSGEDRVRIKMSPVRVLNLLGESGYRVIGASSAGNNGAYAWTMEKKSFAASADSNGAVGNGGQGGGRQQQTAKKARFAKFQAEASPNREGCLRSSLGARIDSLRVR